MVKPFWVKNYTGNDVGLSDLAMKVPANSTIDLFKYKPTLTEDDVRRSKESGSLSKRFEAGILGTVQKPVSSKPHTLNHIKESKDVVKIVKTKGGVLIDTEEEDVLSDSDFGDFADYGIGDLGHKNTEFDTSQKGAVVIHQKQDPDPDDLPAPKVVVKHIDSKKQSVAIMVEQTEASTNPIGPLANTVGNKEGFVVVKDLNQPAVVESGLHIDEAKTIEKPAANETKITKVGKDFVVEAPDDDPSTDVAENTFDVKVATKDESGAIVMQVKEVAKKKSTKKKTSKKK